VSQNLSISQEIREFCDTADEQPGVGRQPRLVASNRNGLLNFEVYVMNADGGAQTRLTINGAVDGEPAWSADGGRIVFSTNRDGLLNFEIYVMNANGGGQTRLTTNSAADTSPDWQPNIVYCLLMGLR
jgi:Tol biopolymer transport system component